MLRAGALRERVTVQAPAGPAVDAYGDETRAWSGGVTVWASVRPETGGERIRSGRLDAVQAYRVMLRYPLPSGDVETTSRIVWGERVLSVLSSTVTPTHDAYDVVAVEG